MDKSELDAMRAAHKAAMDLAVKNAIFFWTWPFIAYSAWVLAFNPRRRGDFLVDPLLRIITAPAPV